MKSQIRATSPAPPPSRKGSRYTTAARLSSAAEEAATPDAGVAEVQTQQPIHLPQAAYRKLLAKVGPTTLQVNGFNDPRLLDPREGDGGDSYFWVVEDAGGGGGGKGRTKTQAQSRGTLVLKSGSGSTLRPIVPESAAPAAAAIGVTERLDRRRPPPVTVATAGASVVPSTFMPTAAALGALSGSEIGRSRTQAPGRARKAEGKGSLRDLEGRSPSPHKRRRRRPQPSASTSTSTSSLSSSTSLAKSTTRSRSGGNATTTNTGDDSPRNTTNRSRARVAALDKQIEETQQVLAALEAQRLQALTS